MPPSPPTIHIHEDPQPILTFLAHHLPKTLPLYRRIQFAQTHPSSSARLLATFPPGGVPLPSDVEGDAEVREDERSTHQKEEEQPYLIAHVDRALAPHAAELYVFTSIELSSSSTSAAPSSAHQHKDQTTASLLLSLFAHCHTLRQGASTNRTPTPTPTPNGTETAPPDPILTASLHAHNLSLLQTHHPSIFTGMKPASGPWTKYLFRFPPSTSTSTSALPPNYSWTRITPPSYAHIAQHNSILSSDPSRDPATILSPLPRAGIRFTRPEEADAGRLIAWGFLGSDGSARTLFVEPAHRGVGLAGRIVRRLVSGEAGGAFALAERGEGGEGQIWGHADTGAENEESVRAFTGRSVEGWVGWCVWWVRVDAAAAAAAAAIAAGEWAGEGSGR